jgi:hypothetical protein
MNMDPVNLAMGPEKILRKQKERGHFQALEGDGRIG